MIQKAYKYRLYPNKEQIIVLNKHFGCMRFVYNHFLAMRKEQKLNYRKTQDILVSMKKDEKYSWLKEVNSQSLLCSLQNLDKAYVKFFREKKGYPKFKSRHNNNHSFSIPQHISLEDSCLFIPKLDSGIKVKLHRQIPEKGKIKTSTISRTPTGKYFVSILVELPDGIKQQNNKVVGLDLGIKHLVITSDGKKYDNPKYYEQGLNKLKYEQRQLSKKNKGSNQRRKQRLLVSRIHEKIKNQRNDILHKISSEIANENQIIITESLRVKNMLQNRHLSKAISDTGWGTFVNYLNYKSSDFVQISTWFPSSKTCSCCGFINRNLTLGDRTWICPECKTKHDRDINAAINIKNCGYGMYSQSKQKQVESLCLQR